ncbi:MAG: GGDEF domain-containing protein [Planctomycetota bacterium]|nr:GGDEF domain-containing protein [Planctomycetota bacterium]
MVAAPSSSPFVSRLMVVADRAQLTQHLRRRYPAVEIAAVPSYMSGIAELAHGPVHAIVAHVDPASAVLEKAVRGLRIAAGESVPMILCCDPEGEPAALRALAAGATDYVIYPPERRELDELLSLESVGTQPAQAAPTDEQARKEALGRALEALSMAPHRLLDRLAELLLAALPAQSAQVSADGAKGQAGSKMTEPVLREPIVSNGEPVGEIALGESSGAGYSRADLDTLHDHSEIIGHILQAARRQHEWKQLALTDDLTALPNRRFLTRSLDRILQRAAREHFRVTVCMFDIDNFKHYNDEFGYPAGDEIIRATGQLLLRRCRVEDVVARYGGDEFVVVFWDSQDPRVEGSQHPEQPMEVMKRFQEALREHDFGALGPKGKGALTISAGLATYPWDATTTKNLLATAAAALRQAKKHGKDYIHLTGAEPGPSSQPE